MKEASLSSAGADQITFKQRKFVEEYCIDQNATRAAISAGYSQKCAYAQGSRLLKNVKVLTEIGIRFDEHRSRCNMTIASLTDELEEARLAAMKANKPSAAVRAVTAKAKLHGFLGKRQSKTISRS